MEALGRFRLVIDFPSENEAEAEYRARLALIHLKAILRTRGLDPEKVTFYGVRELRSDGDRGGG